MASKPVPPAGGDIDVGWQLEVGTTVTFLCAAIVMGLRGLARLKYSKRGWDDYIMVFALVQALVATILDFVATNNGLGRHSFFLTKQQAVDQQFYSLLAQVFCIHAMTFAKISIILSYLRILRGSASLWQQTSLWSVGILTLVVNTVVIITFYAACSPNAKSWNPTISGTCWPLKARVGFVILQGSWSAFSDFFLALFPFVMFRKLQLGRTTKTIVLVLMGLSLITGIFSIIRTVEGGTQLTAPPTATPDQSFASIQGLMWAGMERNLAIVFGSAPALRPLAPPVKEFLSSTFRTSKQGWTERDTYPLSNGHAFRKVSENSQPVGRAHQNTENSNKYWQSREHILREERV